VVQLKKVEYKTVFIFLLEGKLEKIERPVSSNNNSNAFADYVNQMMVKIGMIDLT